MKPYTLCYLSKNSIRAERRASKPSSWPRPADFLLALALSWGSIAGLVYAIYHWRVAR
jgi:hypothetical protein